MGNDPQRGFADTIKGQRIPRVANRAYRQHYFQLRIGFVQSFQQPGHIVAEVIDLVKVFFEQRSRHFMAVGNHLTGFNMAVHNGGTKS